MWYCEVLMPGYSAEIALKRSSQYGMVIAMPLDFVAEVTCFFLRVFASSKAKRMMRSVPRFENTESCVTNSWSVPAYMRPPIDEYSPSLFSRTTQKSMSPGLAVGERARDSRHEPHRPQVHVELELAPDRDEQAPERDVVGNAGESHGAEEDRVVAADLCQAVVGHHLPVLAVVLAAPRLLVPLQREPELAPRGLQNALAFGNDFLADAVPGDHRDAMPGNGPSPVLSFLLHAKNLSSSSVTRSGTSSGR